VRQNPPRALPPVPQAHHAATVGAQIHAAPVQFNPEEHAPTPVTGAAVQAKPTVDTVAIPAPQTGIPSSQSPELAAPVVEVPAAPTPTEQLPEKVIIATEGNVGINAGAPAPAAPVTVDAIVADKDLLELDLKEHLDVALREFMLVDLQTERSEHEWPLYAAQKWHRDYCLKLCLCETHEQRMDMVKEKADAALFSKILELWKKEGSANGYNLLMAWSAFIREVMTPTPQTAPEATASSATTEGVKA
jgi:hypothetical protein